MKVRFFNIVLLCVAIVCTWFTHTQTENKIVLTVLFSLCLGFWIVAKKNAKEVDTRNEKIKFILKHGLHKP